MPRAGASSRQHGDHQPQSQRPAIVSLPLFTRLFPTSLFLSHLSPHDRHISPTRARLSPPSGTVPLFRKRTAASTDQPEPSHSPPHWPPQCQREALLASRTSNRNDSPGHGRSHWPPQCQREALLGRGISFRMAGSEELAPATSAPPGPASPEPHPAERYSPVPHLSDPQPAEPESAGNAPVPGHIA